MKLDAERLLAKPGGKSPHRRTLNPWNEPRREAAQHKTSSSSLPSGFCPIGFKRKFEEIPCLTGMRHYAREKAIQPGQLHLKIFPVVESLGKLPSRPGDSCDQREIGPLAERFRFFPAVARPGEHVASDFRPRRDDAMVA